MLVEEAKYHLAFRKVMVALPDKTPAVSRGLKMASLLHEEVNDTTAWTKNELGQALYDLLSEGRALSLPEIPAGVVPGFLTGVRVPLSENYIVVFDVDEASAKDEVVRLFGETTTVKTRRGFHLYYQAHLSAIPIPQKLTLPDGRVVGDVKSFNGYVIAPGYPVGGYTYEVIDPRPMRLLDQEALKQYRIKTITEEEADKAYALKPAFDPVIARDKLLANASSPGTTDTSQKPPQEPANPTTTNPQVHAVDQNELLKKVEDTDIRLTNYFMTRVCYLNDSSVSRFSSRSERDMVFWLLCYESNFSPKEAVYLYLEYIENGRYQKTRKRINYLYADCVRCYSKFRSGFGGCRKPLPPEVNLILDLIANIEDFEEFRDMKSIQRYLVEVINLIVARKSTTIPLAHSIFTRRRILSKPTSIAVRNKLKEIAFLIPKKGNVYGDLYEVSIEKLKELYQRSSHRNTLTFQNAQMLLSAGLIHSKDYITPNNISYYIYGILDNPLKQVAEATRRSMRTIRRNFKKLHFLLTSSGLSLEEFLTKTAYDFKDKVLARAKQVLDECYRYKRYLAFIGKIKDEEAKPLHASLSFGRFGVPKLTYQLL